MLITQPSVIGVPFSVELTDKASGGKTCTTTINIPDGYAVVQHCKPLSMYISGYSTTQITDRDDVTANGNTISFWYYLYNPSGYTGNLFLCGTILCYRTDVLVDISQDSTSKMSVLGFYPVGSYYETSDDSFDPNIAWGGTWERETAGYVHLAKGDFYYVQQHPVVNLISTYYELIDGAYVLTSDTEIDNTKTYYSLKTYSSGEVGGENEHKLTTSELPVHTHTVAVPNKTLSKQSQTVASGSNASVLLSTTSLTQSSTTISTRSSGSGLTHNIMQPYIVINRWHRIA